MWWRFQIYARQHRSFWRLLRLVSRSRFLSHRQKYLASEKLIAAKSAAQILTNLASVTFVSLVAALVTAGLLLLSEVYFPNGRGFWFLPIPLWHIDDRDSYSSFLSTISGIGGVLIALYYTGMVAAGSAVYARAPGVLRNLLLREPIGKLYMGLVAFTTFLSLCLLAFFAIGFSPIRLAFPLLILLSGLTILSFVQLGQQAFHLFDPTRLSGTLFEDMERCLRRSTVYGTFWSDPSFQSHVNRQAHSALKALNTLADFSIADRHLRTDAIADVAVSTIGFLYRYETAKRLIPTRSKWYPTRYSHPDFYLAGDLNADMAMRTSGSVQPDTEPQENWVEELALGVVMRALASNLREKNDTGTFRILANLLAYSEHLGESWEVESALALTTKIADVILPLALPSTEASEDAPRWQLGVLEYLSLFPTSILLGFAKSLSNTSTDHLREMLASVRWQKQQTLYRSGFFRFALPSLEWFEPRLQFEAQAEGRRVTPDWFILQVVSRDHLKVLQSSLEYLLNVSERLFGAWLSKCEEAKDPWAKAVILNRQGEYLNKLSANLAESLRVESDYETTKVLSDLKGWPPSKVNSFKYRVSTVEDKYSLAIAKAAADLAKNKKPSQLPDYAGEFLARTARTLVRAILANEWNHFEEVFPYFWESSINKFVFLISAETAGGEDQVFKFALSSAPMVDLMEISGFAILVSEMNQAAEPWNWVQQIWDRYLKDIENGPSRIDILARSLRACDIPMMIPPGDIARIEWRTQASSWIAQHLGLNPNARWSSGFGGQFGQRVMHSSALIRVLARDTFFGMYRGTDIFAAIYLNDLPGANLGGGRTRFNNLVAELKMESSRGESANLDEEDDPDDSDEI
jgi:hypothetical protein